MAGGRKRVDPGNEVAESSGAVYCFELEEGVLVVLY